MSAHLIEAWERRVLGSRFTFDVDFAHDKDTLKAGEVVGGTHRVTTEGRDETEARLVAEQMVAATGREPTGSRRVAASDRPRFPVPTSQEYMLEHLHSVHGMPVSAYEQRHVKADVVHQWHTDAHANGDLGASNHDHSGKLRQRKWAQSPDDPERTIDGTGYYQKPPQGDDQQIRRFLDRYDR